MEERMELVPAPASTLQMVFTYGGQELGTDTDTLPFRHYNQAGSPVGFGCKQRRHGHMANRFAVDNTDKVFSSYRKRQV